MSNNGDKDKSRFTTRNKYDEFYRLHFHESEKGVWFAQFDKPIPIKIPLEQQVEHLMKHAYLSDCNIAFAKMYGYEDPNEMIGVRFPRLFNNAEAANLENLRAVIESNYRINQIESCEIDKNGMRKYFLNDAVGVIEDNYLVRVWGVQHDISAEKSQREVLKQLTPDQLSVLKTTVEGKTMKEIASVMGISPKTVESIRNQIKTILGVDTQAQLISKAVQLGIQNIEA